MLRTVRRLRRRRKVSGPRFKFNGKLGTVRSTNGRLMVIGGAGAMPIWDFMEKLQRKAAR